MSTYTALRKRILSRLAGSPWKKKAIWLAADYPDYASNIRGELKFLKFGINLAHGQHEFMMDGFTYLKELYDLGNFHFYMKSEELFAKGNFFSAVIHTAEELFILKEICLNCEYNFKSLRPVVVVDIGMNVGLASLYFASRKDVLHVYGYEPFKPTYQQAARNLEINPEISAKVTGMNYGLSDCEKNLEVDYNFENKGQVGIHGVRLVRSRIQSVRKERIQLKPVLPEIGKIIAKHPEAELVCKIDCEGAEYDLFKMFTEYGIPPAIKTIMVEWHERGPRQLEEALALNNFRSVTTYADSQNVGMVYAFR